jgi:hypothetical protein
VSVSSGSSSSPSSTDFDLLLRERCAAAIAGCFCLDVFGFGRFAAW